MAYYEKFTKPGFYNFILPRKAKADLVVPTLFSGCCCCSVRVYPDVWQRVRSRRERKSLGWKCLSTNLNQPAV